MANAPTKPRRFAFILILALVIAMLAMGFNFHLVQTKRKRDIAATARTAAITALKKAGATIEDSPTALQISFRGTTLDDESLATIAVHLRAFNWISVLDLRCTRVNGQTLSVLLGLPVWQIVLDPEQINSVSIGQLIACRYTNEIKLSGDDVTEEVIVGLLPAFQGWRGILVIDAISNEGLARLDSEAPNLRGARIGGGWHPIAEAWKGPASVN
jgi:hypothetical protein